MGMAASQARLLSITARLTDNENSGQNLSQSKMRLADRTQQINSDYMAALNATKLTVLTGFNGSNPTYSDISYNLMTGYETIALGKQYVVTDKKGRVLVTDKQAQAFQKGNGNLNVFLANLGYSLIDIKIPDPNNSAEMDVAMEKVHKAWDTYFKSVGKGFGDPEHDDGANITFGYTDFEKNGAYDGYVGYGYLGDDPVSGQPMTNPLNYEGTTQEQRELYDYAFALTEAVLNQRTIKPDPNDPSKDYQVNKSCAQSLKTNADANSSGMITHLTNLFYKMAEAGYYTEKDESKTIKDNKWFEEQLRKGELLLECYSTKEKKFISTAYDEDSSIQEVEDERQIALVEAKYTMDMTEVEQQDSKIDMELKRIDTEHNALQTEYDAVKGVIDKNVEKTFNIFS